LVQKILAPVLVGDTIHAEIEVTGVRPTSTKNRAIVSSDIRVFNQHGVLVMTYSATRLLAGRPTSQG
jgi:acyl dehydratase